MKIKEIIKYEKENLPSYQFKFNYFFMFPFLVFVLLGAVVVAILTDALTKKHGDILVAYLPLIIWCAILLLAVVAMIIVGRLIQKRLRKDKTQELTEKFKELLDDEIYPYLEKAKVASKEGFYTYDLEKEEEEYLRKQREEKGIEKDGNGEIEKDEESGAENSEKTAGKPLEEETTGKPLGILAKRDALILINGQYFTGQFFLRVAVIDQKTSNIVAVPLLSAQLYNYINKNQLQILNNEVYQLLLSDKKEFVKMLLAYNTTDNVTKILLKKTKKGEKH